MLMVAAMCLPRSAKDPAESGADEKGDRSDECGEAQRSKGWAGEVEEVGHGEGVTAYIAVCEKSADVGDVGKIARLP